MDTAIVSDKPEISVNAAMNVFIKKKQEEEFLNSVDRSIAQADNCQKKDAFASFDNITQKLESRKKDIG